MFDVSILFWLRHIPFVVCVHTPTSVLPLTDKTGYCRFRFCRIGLPSISYRTMTFHQNAVHAYGPFFRNTPPDVKRVITQTLFVYCRFPLWANGIFPHPDIFLPASCRDSWLPVGSHTDRPFRIFKSTTICFIPTFPLLFSIEVIIIIPLQS